jgi:uncharacterized membrane protein
MTQEATVLFWWLAFAGTHLTGSTVPVRTWLIGKAGLAGFKVIYSLVALATFIPLVVVYWTNRHGGTELFEYQPALIRVSEGLMLAAIFFLVHAALTMNPMSSVTEMSGAVVRSAHRVTRITRHPTNTAFGLFAVAHMIMNPYEGDWYFFGGFLAYVLLSAWHQDRRFLATHADTFGPFYETTSYVPFLAILQGRQRLGIGDYRWWSLLITVGLFFGLRYMHPLWIGGY